jgi:hypothetical protein
VKLALITVTLSLCLACGPPPLAGATRGDESSDSSTATSSTATSSTETSETETSETETSETDGGSTLSGGHFLVPEGDLDGGNTPCEPFEQDCARGEKCVPYGSTGGWQDANKCVPVVGDQAAGEPCSYDGLVDATDDCDATGACWNTQEVEGELVGTCHSFCTGTQEMPECPQGYECLLSSDSVVTLCFPDCDPVAQDCADELGCYWSGIAFICTATLESPGVSPGQPCGFANDCEVGSMCLDASVIPNCMGSGCCGSFCDLGLGDAHCAAVPGTSCVPFWEQGTAPAGYEHVGICVVGP